MATAPVITGAPTCATIIPFPLPPLRRFRVDLARCRSRRMVDGWLARVQRADNGLSRQEYLDLALRGLERGRVLRAMEGC